jgi:hypothetical protein
MADGLPRAPTPAAGGLGVTGARNDAPHALTLALAFPHMTPAELATRFTRIRPASRGEFYRVIHSYSGFLL